MEKSYHSKRDRSSSCIERRHPLKMKKPMLSILQEQMKDGITEWRSPSSRTNFRSSSSSVLGRIAYSILLMKWVKLYGITSCGAMHIRSRIKRLWNQFYLWRWRNKYGYFYCNHCCVGCEYFDNCMSEFNLWAMKALDEHKVHKFVEGPIDMYEE